MGNGVEEDPLTSRKELLLSQPGLDAFVRAERITINEVLPSSLLGVPLRVEEKTIGGIIVSQYSTQASEYFERDKRILLSVTNQVAGAIQISRLAEAEKAGFPSNADPAKEPAPKCSALCRKARIISGYPS